MTFKKLNTIFTFLNMSLVGFNGLGADIVRKSESISPDYHIVDFSLFLEFDDHKKV